MAAATGSARPPDPANRLAAFVARARADGRLVVQPRMGFPGPEAMRAGLCATRDAAACAVGTITLDSFTRTGDHAAARRALARGAALNGFPLILHGPQTVNAILADVASPDFPVQVRHGTALPDEVLSVLLRTEVDATEGGPVSYTLPYGRTPLEQTIRSWARCCSLLAAEQERGTVWHLETFGGCMLGQLCPPELLIALSLLEGLFFAQGGVRSISLSYAQQTNRQQDLEALAALRALAADLLPEDVDRHIVLYTWMGVFPRSAAGAERLLKESAVLARDAAVERLVVKTAAEAHRIPTVAENVAALEMADATARAVTGQLPDVRRTGILDAARRLVEQVLTMADDIGEALLLAFHEGLLDVPYCLHPDNRNRARSYIDADGWLRWADTGAMPISPYSTTRRAVEPTAAELLEMLDFNRRRFDD